MPLGQAAEIESSRRKGLQYLGGRRQQVGGELTMEEAPSSWDSDQIYDPGFFDGYNYGNYMVIEG